MRQIHGLEVISKRCHGRINSEILAEILLAELQNCSCAIYGAANDDHKILLATLYLRPETLSYEKFDQRIDLALSGPILRADAVPLTYRLQGQQFAISGRCSVIPKVCGVDWYLQRHNTTDAGENIRQKFSIPVKPLLQELRKTIDF